MSRIGDEILAAYNLLLMPAPDTFLLSTKQDCEWNDVVLSLVSHIEQAALSGLHAFDRRDWKLTAGGNWTVPAAADRAKFPPRAGVAVFPPMALRPRTETYSYLDCASIGADSLVRRGTAALQVRAGSDYLDHV